MKILRVLILSMLLILLPLPLTGPVSASYDPQSESSEAEAVVSQAFANLQNYAFHSELNTVTHLTDESGETTDAVAIALLQGLIAANGDRQTNLKQFSGSDLLSALTKRATIIDQIRIGNERYVNVGNIEYLEVIEPGWWRYDDLSSQFTTASNRYLLDAALQVQVPSEYPVMPDYIQSVTEQEAEFLYNIPMRVFEIEFDALALTLAQMPGTPEEKEAATRENQALVDASELSLTYHVWIGAEDGLLYKGTITGHSFYPYLTVSGSETGNPPYDITIETTGSFEITDHEAQTDFTAPEVNQLPEP